MANGQRIEAHTEDGFYATLVPRGSEPASCVVETGDGKRTTIPAD